MCPDAPIRYQTPSHANRSREAGLAVQVGVVSVEILTSRIDSYRGITNATVVVYDFIFLGFTYQHLAVTSRFVCLFVNADHSDGPIGGTECLVVRNNFPAFMIFGVIQADELVGIFVRVDGTTTGVTIVKCLRLRL